MPLSVNNIEQFRDINHNKTVKNVCITGVVLPNFLGYVELKLFNSFL